MEVGRYVPAYMRRANVMSDGRRYPTESGQRADRRDHSANGARSYQLYDLSASVSEDDVAKIEAKYGKGPYKIVAHGQRSSSGRVMIAAADDTSDSIGRANAEHLSFLSLPDHFLVPRNNPEAAPG